VRLGDSHGAAWLCDGASYGRETASAMTLFGAIEIAEATRDAFRAIGVGGSDFVGGD